MERPLADFRGKVCVVTGASSGIGKETARNLCLMGATVVLGCRDRARGEENRREIAAAGGRAELECVDVSRPVSIRTFAASILRRHPQIHVLINNAGVWSTQRWETADGFELTWATNVLGYHLTATSLLPALRAGAPSRIVYVASTYVLDVDTDDPEFRRKPYHGIAAYRQSKAADRMLAWALSRRLADSDVTANAVHPGGVNTGIYRDARGLLGTLTRAWVSATKLSPRQGADAPTWIAVAPSLQGVTGKFFVGRREAPCHLRDEMREERLWRICEDMSAADLARRSSQTSPRRGAPG